MPRATTTSDVFNAIAEPRRRDIIGFLSRDISGGYPVGTLVEALRLPQPTVSKHLAVLRTVGLVSVRKLGQQRVYRLNPGGIKTVHDWTRTFERYWEDQLLRIKQRAEAKSQTRDR